MCDRPLATYRPFEQSASSPASNRQSTGPEVGSSVWNVNVAVVDTDLSNGAIDMVPGSHKKFYKYWRFAMERPNRAAIRIPMRQGDVLVRNSNVWHRGMPNKTATPRPMLAFTWEDGGAQESDPFAVNGGNIAFRQNWFRPTRLGRLRERTFVAAPITYSTYRFVSSLFDGSKGYDHQ